MNHYFQVVGLHFFENKTNGELKPIATRKEEKTIVPLSGGENLPYTSKPQSHD
jgi:hypothetical protein